LPDSHSLHASWVFAKHLYGIKQKRIAINEKYYIRDADNRDVFFALRRVYIWRRLGAIFLSIIVLFASIFFLVSVGSSMDLPLEILMPVFLVISLAACIATLLYLQPIRHIEFFNSESDTLTSKPEFTVTQDKKIELITQNYTLRDKMGIPVAFFSKNQFTNIIRRKWHVRYGNKYVLIQEDSIILSLMRRLLPFWQFIRTNFVYFQMKNHTEKWIILGMFKRKIELFDNYVLDLSPDPSYSIPRQVAIAIAVLLDTGEKR
jgi:uncharacterized protein YxjI